MVDTSISMKPKMGMVREGISKTIDDLVKNGSPEYEYLVSLVQFSDTSRFVFVDVPLNNFASDILDNYLQSLEASGNTDLYGGICLALRESFVDSLYSVTILTDGENTINNKMYDYYSAKVMVETRIEDNWLIDYYGITDLSVTEAKNMGIAHSYAYKEHNVNQVFAASNNLRCSYTTAKSAANNGNIDIRSLDVDVSKI